MTTKTHKKLEEKKEKSMQEVNASTSKALESKSNSNIDATTVSLNTSIKDVDLSDELKEISDIIGGQLLRESLAEGSDSVCFANHSFIGNSSNIH